MVYSNAGAMKHVLTISLSKQLTGHPIMSVIEKDWSKPMALPAVDHFDNAGFDVDGNNFNKIIFFV